MKPLILGVIVASVLLSGCHNVSPTTGSQPGTVVIYDTGKILNLSAFKKFLMELHLHRKDSVHIVSYTTEGDPIFTDLSFDGHRLRYTWDNTKDRFGGTNRSRKSTTCTGITLHSTLHGAEYVVVGKRDPEIPSTLFIVPNPRRSK